MKKKDIILQILAENGGWMYGQEIVAVSKNKLKLYSLYSILSRMEEKGYVTSKHEFVPDDRIPRALFKITKDGRGLRNQADLSNVSKIFPSYPNIVSS